MTDPNGFTIHTLKEFFLALLHESDLRQQQRFEAQERALTLQLAAVREANQIMLTAQREATNSALVASKEAIAAAQAVYEYDKRAANEWRGTLTDMTQEFSRKTEVETKITSSLDKIYSLEKRLTMVEGRGSGASSLWAYLVGAVGIVGGLIGIAVAMFRK